MRRTDESQALFLRWLEEALAAGRGDEEILESEIQIQLARMGLGDRLRDPAFRDALLAVTTRHGYVFRG